MKQYLFDLQGSVCQRLDGSGSAQTASLPDAWGYTQDGDTNDPFAYDGRDGYYRDGETSVYLCGQRYYDPTGRWLTRDPIGYAGGINLYGYCGGGPVGNADPSGLDFVYNQGLFSEHDQNLIRKHLDMLRRSPSHEAIMRSIDADKKHHVYIRPLGTDPYNPGWMASHHHGSKQSLDEAIYYDPQSTLTLNKKGPNKTTISSPPDVVLAHEVGHCDINSDPKEDALIQSSDVVGKYENPYRKSRRPSLPPRVRY